MISFKYKTTTKQIKIKSKDVNEERMSPWLQEQFGIRNPIVGFKVPSNKYYDAQSFYQTADKFFGQLVEIIDANDQLEVSFLSDNLNSSSFIKPSQPNSDDVKKQEYNDEDAVIVADTKTLQKKLSDQPILSVYFQIHPLYRKQVNEILGEIKKKNKAKLMTFIKLNTEKFKNPTCSIYSGRKKIIGMKLTKQIKEVLERCLNRYAQPKKWQQEQHIFKTSYEQENQAPSFTTYQLQERLNQEACLDYLARMLQEKILKKYEYTKLCEKCEQNFVEFYRIFCEGIIDNDYDNFKNEIMLKVENNLQLLLSNVEEMDLSRPISREEQRKQNLKKSVPKLQIVKVENYFQILDQLTPFLSYDVMGEIKAELLEESEEVFACFSDFLSRKINKEELAVQLQKAIRKDNNKKLMPRCPPTRLATRARSSNFEAENQKSSRVPEQATQIRLMGSGNQKNETKEVPPMFGSSKNQNNFSPIKYMSDIQSNYRQAWVRLQSRANSFEPQEYGLLYYYLQSRDDRISNHIQQLQWNEQSSIENLRNFLRDQMKEIMTETFTEKELSIVESLRNSTDIDCIFQNFKYQSDLNHFLSSLKDEIAHHKSELLSPEKVLLKKKSDSQLLSQKEKGIKKGRRYSDEQENVSSPKGSQFSIPKTTSSLQQLDMLNIENLWVDQFEEMLEFCNFTEERKEEYIRDAFREGNPSVYLWINNFCQKKLVIDVKELKTSLKIKDSENRIVRVVPILNQIMKQLADQGKISHHVRKWNLAQLIDMNLPVLATFEQYIRFKNEFELIENLNLIYEMENNEMNYYRNYMKRIEDLLKAMSIEDDISMQIFNFYPQQIKAICQLYYVTGNTEELLENLHVIHSIESKKRKLKCASLNFTGIGLSPFEYHDGSEELKQINERMKSILQKEAAYFEGCNLSLIDKFFCNNRMSVRFGKEMVLNDRLPNKEEYLKMWHRYYQTNKPAQIINDTPEVQQKYAMFDYFCYVSLVSYLYNIKLNANHEIDGITELQVGKFIQFLEQGLNRPSSRLDVKQQMAMDFIFKNDIDVMFIQEGGDVNWADQLVHEYHLMRNSNSVIIFRKDKIGGLKTNLQEHYKERLNFNNDSACFFSQKGYLLVSVHLTSKSKHVQQAQEMFATLAQIQKQHPMLKIIVGIDANHFIKGTNNNFLNTVPGEEVQTTTTKKRTHLQVQFHKADQEVKQIKDQILSTLPIREYSINIVDGSVPPEHELLPNSKHPFDHFIVLAQI